VLAAVLFVLCRIRVPEVKCEVVPAVVLPGVAAAAGGLFASSLSADFPTGAMKLAGEAGVLVIGYLAMIWLLGGRGRLVDLAELVRDAVWRPARVVASSGQTGESS